MENVHASRIDTAMFWAPRRSTRRVLAFGAWLLLYYNMCAGVKWIDENVGMGVV